MTWTSPSLALFTRKRGVLGQFGRWVGRLYLELAVDM